MARLVVAPIARVWPSGADFAKRPIPIAPFAPDTFSTTTGWPSVAYCAKARPRTSLEPPGNETMSRIGLAGESCALSSDMRPIGSVARSSAARMRRQGRFTTSFRSGDSGRYRALERAFLKSIHGGRGAPAPVCLFDRIHDLDPARRRIAAPEIHALSVVGDGDLGREAAPGNRDDIGSRRASRAVVDAVHDSPGAVPIEVGAAGSEPELVLFSRGIEG